MPGSWVVQGGPRIGKVTACSPLEVANPWPLALACPPLAGAFRCVEAAAGMRWASAERVVLSGLVKSPFAPWQNEKGETDSPLRAKGS